MWTLELDQIKTVLMVSRLHAPSSGPDEGQCLTARAALLLGLSLLHCIYLSDQDVSALLHPSRLP